MSAALSESGQRIKVRHSRHSRLRLGEARQALAIVHTIADDFAAQVAELARHHHYRPAVGPASSTPTSPPAATPPAVGRWQSGSGPR